MIQDHTHPSIDAKTYSLEGDGQSKVEKNIIVSYQATAFEDNFKHRKENTSWKILGI